MNQVDYNKLADTLPDLPGVYRFIGDEEVILYVGKAKNLKNRVANYFTGGNNRSYKTRSLVRQARRVEFTVMNSEHDALLLENNLIKEHQPKYNINLRDDKTYTYICIKNERFPRVFFTRKVIRDGSTYFGPYTSKYKAKIVLDLITKLFPIRTCSLPLTQRKIEANKFKVCLEYHIGNCLGPCEGLESESEYNEKISRIKEMLKGRLSQVKRQMREEMSAAAEQLDFERAQRLKVNLDALSDYQSKSAVVTSSRSDIDVFDIIDRDPYAYISYLKIVEGRIIHAYSIEAVKNLEDDLSDILGHSIYRIRERFDSQSSTLVLPMEVTLTDPDIHIIIPQRGDKKDLLDLAKQNAYFFAQQVARERKSKTSRQGTAERILSKLKADLNMEQMPIHIECFDNSNIQGNQPVAACVVFKNARPSKSDYRKFHVKTVEGPNDFASMEEIVYRRYKRLLDEKQSLPQLIIIDGGKGQLSSAMKSIRRLQIEDQVTVIGIAKRLEEIYFPGDSIPLYINKKSESLKLIQQLRNEAHRFAITFHRDTRSKQFTHTELLHVPGIGPKTAQKLLKSFKSMKRLRAADPKEVIHVVGNRANQALQNYFHGEEE